MTGPRIAFSLPQSEYGGLHRLVEVLHDPLASLGLDVLAVTPAGSGVAGRMSGIRTVVEVDGLATLPHPRRRPTQVIATVARTRSVVRRAAAAIGPRPQAVHVFGFLDVTGPALARHTGASLVRSVNSSIVPVGALPVARRVMARADAGLYEGVPLLLSYAPRRGHRSVVFYPAGDPPPAMDEGASECRAAVRGRLGVPLDRTVVGTWSNITNQKGLTDFVRYAGDLASRRDDLHFVVAGRAVRGHESYLASVRRVADADRRLSDRITFAVAGELDRERAFRLLDVLALTSKFEGIATTTIEAMWRYVPVVAHDVGSVADIVIDDLTGSLVTRGDSAMFGRAVERIIEDVNHRTQLTATARARVEALCSTDRLVESFMSAYGPLIRGWT